MARAICRVDSCSRNVRSTGLCNLHYLKERRYGDPEVIVVKRQHAPGCGVEGCTLPYKAHGYCNVHMLRWKKHGDPLRLLQPNRGSGYVNSEGYRVVSRIGHPMARPDGAILEHRLVMSETLGRPLYPDETVHHLNGDKLDNRPENLELWTGRHPRGARVSDHLAWAREVIERYAGTPYDPQGRSHKGDSRD